MPDDRTLVFLPGGLGVGVQMAPQTAAEYWVSIADRLALHTDVADETRRAFGDLVGILPYGVLHYEIFTLVHDRALFVLEQALRDRLAAYGPVSRQAGLATLLKQARSRGLLAGQYTRVVEKAIKNLRDGIAHRSGYHLLAPPIAARGLRDLAEIINHLWGHGTPGGRLYPLPLTRRTVVLAWDAATRSTASSLAENLLDPSGWEEFADFAIVQAPWPSAPDLHDYDAWFETTALPVDYRWGPGPRAAAIDWLAQHPPVTDTAAVLGRRFLIRAANERLWWPIRVLAAAGLPPDRRGGKWYLVGADSPAAAFTHVLNALTEDGQCSLEGTCPGCDAFNAAGGDLEAVLAHLELKPDSSGAPPEFHLPNPMSERRSRPLPDKPH